MYYRLREPWSFRGWKRLPFALRAESGPRKYEKPLFFNREQFMLLLSCNGEEPVCPENLKEGERGFLRQLVSEEMVEESEAPLPALQSWQRYHVFPSRYTESIHWSITGKCNFSCRHCLISAPGAHLPQLPLESCLHIVNEIASCGIRRVDITGGEPLVRRDFAEIVRALSERRISIGILFTNASLLTAETLDMLESFHQRPTFQISFDGLGHHDWLRGVPGAEKEADAAFRLLRERGYMVNVAMCVHKENQASLADTMRYLTDMGVYALRISAPQELGVWRQYTEDYALSQEEVWNLFRDFIPRYFEAGMPLRLELDGFFRCEKGKTAYRIPYVHKDMGDTPWCKIPYCESTRENLHISPDGRLAPCMGFTSIGDRNRFPSVLEHPLGELTLAGGCYDVVKTSIEDLLEKNPECRACEHLVQCQGGCMLESATEDGNWLIPDARCCYFHKHIGEAAVRSVADEAIRKYCGAQGTEAAPV